jgi:uncharacterized membrane protein HdeD (DUF308 family)
MLIGGILAFIVGAVLLWSPAKTKADTWLLLTTLLGVWWLIQGVIDIVSMFTDHRAWGWKLFIGIVSIIAGGYILMYPIAAALALPRIFVLVLGIWGLIYGVVLIALAFRGGGWGSGLLGALGIIFGIILILNYSAPGMGLSLLWTGAIFALVWGAIMVVQAIRLRTA